MLRLPCRGCEGFAGLSKEVATGVNILKGGSDPPLLPDEEYPEWLWELADPEPTLFELRRRYEAAGKDIEHMEMHEVSFLSLRGRRGMKKRSLKGGGDWFNELEE